MARGLSAKGRAGMLLVAAPVHFPPREYLSYAYLKCEPVARMVINLLALQQNINDNFTDFLVCVLRQAHSISPPSRKRPAQSGPTNVPKRGYVLNPFARPDQFAGWDAGTRHSVPLLNTVLIGKRRGHCSPSGSQPPGATAPRNHASFSLFLPAASATCRSFADPSQTSLCHLGPERLARRSASNPLRCLHPGNPGGNVKMIGEPPRALQWEPCRDGQKDGSGAP